MTRLSNSNLLDDQVGQNMNNESLKTKRIEQVAEIANKPVGDVQVPVSPQNVLPPQRENVIQMNPTVSRMNQNIVKSDISDEDLDEDDYQPTKDVMPLDNKNKKSDDDKILGMNPILFYGLVAVVVGVGGYFAYKKLFNKGVKDGVKSITPNTPKVSIQPTSEVITETIKPAVGVVSQVTALPTI